MNTQVEQLENSQVALTVEVAGDVVGKAINKAYNEMKKDFSIPGFRKGKVPRAMIEKMYGTEVFFNRAVDFIIDETLQGAVEENNIDMAARLREGDIEVKSMTKDAMTYVAKITLKPEVTLGDYKALTVEVEKTEVTEEEVDSAIHAEAVKNAREVAVTDRTVEPQDKVVIDFEGFVDGEAFEGGLGTDYSLVIGSKTFIDGFEDQLIGKTIGQEEEINVTFPENYQAEQLAGKPAVFKVTVKEIKVQELPEINDDFAADVSEFETLAEYKASLKENLAKDKEASRTREIENKSIEKAVANATFDLPNNMVEDEIDRSVQNFEMRMRQQGLEIAQYLQFTGQDMEAFRENFKKDSEAQLRSRLVLEQIVAAEAITATEEEVEAKLAEIAGMYKMDVAEFKKSIGEYHQSMIEADIKVEKAVAIVTSTAVVVEK